MTAFAQLSLRTQLITAFAAVSLIGAAVSGVGIRNMSMLNDEADTMYSRELIALSHVKEANIDMVYLARDRRNAMLATTEAERQTYLEKSEGHLQSLRAHLDKARPLFFSAEGKGYLDEIDQVWRDYTRMGEKLHEMIGASSLDDRAELTRFLFGDFAQQAGKLDELLTQLARLKEKNAADTSARTSAIYASARNTMIALVAGALLLAPRRAGRGG